MFKTIPSTLLTSLAMCGGAIGAQQAHVSLEKDVLLESPEQQRLEVLFQQEDLEQPPAPPTTAINHAQQTTETYSPALYHWIAQLPQVDVIELEDGSLWSIDPHNAHVVEDWTPDAPIIISPKSRCCWKSHAPYVLTNHNTGEWVGTRLIEGPTAFGNHTTWIVATDCNNGRVHLMNAQGELAVWEVAPSDASCIQAWSIDQSLIVGENTRWLWLFSDYNHILINVEMGHFVSARPTRCCLDPAKG